MLSVVRRALSPNFPLVNNLEVARTSGLSNCGYGVPKQNGRQIDATGARMSGAVTVLAQPEMKCRGS